MGCHVSSSGGFHKAIINGTELGVNTIQLHPSPPQRWNRDPFPSAYEEQFLEAKKDSPVEKVFFHAIYLINLANPDPQMRELSINSLVHHLDLNARIGGDGVVVHLGSFKDQPDIEIGIKTVVEALDQVIDKSLPDSRLLLEVAAGSGKIIGADAEQLGEIYED